MASPRARPTSIVVADGYTLNPGDLDWAPLLELGQVSIYDRCGDTLAERCRGAKVVLTNKEVFDAELLSQLSELEFISVLATGTNVVDLEAARARGVVVSNVPAYSTTSVVQHTFALLLALTNRVEAHAQAASDGTWVSSEHFSYRLQPISELAGKVFGIIGFGAIGQAVAQVAWALGMHVCAAEQRSTPRLKTLFPQVEWLPRQELFRRADVISLHCPLTEETRGLVGQEQLRAMQPQAILLNTARGPLIDEAALASVLRDGALGGAGLDVLSEEPPRHGSELLGAPRCLITPHVAWASVEARQRLFSVTLDNVRAFLSGAPIHRVA